MFIKKLYQYSKILCISTIVFLLVFIYINYKWGITATPVLQYGMFSTPFYIKDTQTVYRIEANGKMINNAVISLIDRDIIQISLENYERQRPVNTSAYTTMKKYISYIGLGSFMNSEKFTNSISDSEFTNWYKLKLEKIIKQPIKSLAVYKQQFIWQATMPEPIDSPSKLTCIVFN